MILSHGVSNPAQAQGSATMAQEKSVKHMFKFKHMFTSGYPNCELSCKKYVKVHKKSQHLIITNGDGKRYEREKD